MLDKETFVANMLTPPPKVGTGHSVGLNGGDAAEKLRICNAALSEENARLIEIVSSRDAFLSIVSHELRNPMTPIVVRVGLLRHMISKPDFELEKLDHSLEQIEWLISRYMQRATMLLDVSRFNSGKFRLTLEPVEICQLIQDVAESLKPNARNAGSSIAFEMPQSLIVLGDQLSLEQIIDNLLSNAIKYGDGNPICISASLDADRDVAVICVRDGGPGIEDQNQARIFEHFERAVRPGVKISGFGVGLWIVRRLTEAMGGAIAVQSERGHGSTFTVTLPLRPAEPSQ